jgi:hypothetical protein
MPRRVWIPLLACACIPSSYGTTLGESIAHIPQPTFDTSTESTTDDPTSSGAGPAESSTAPESTDPTSTTTSGVVPSDTSSGDSSTSDVTSSETGESTSAEPNDTCTNKIKDAGESDTDCGGPCVPCPKNHMCGVDPDCLSGYCLNGLCAESSCTTEANCPVATSDCLEFLCIDHKCILTPRDDGKPCKPASLCTTNDICSNGACVGPQLDCSGLDTTCTRGECDLATGQCISKPDNEGAICDDHNECTTTEACEQGVCKPDDSEAVYFFDSFADNSKGWQLGNEWSIDSAMISVDTNQGHPDPASDHTPGLDNRIAGVVIGGSAGTAVHDFYYLVSPVLVTPPDPKPLVLSFWRWLNTDVGTLMENRVEVFDGMDWKTIDAVPAMNPISEKIWTRHSYDVSDYKNPNLRVRIGHKVVNSMNLHKVGSWNIDDVTLASVDCTPP